MNETRMTQNFDYIQYKLQCCGEANYTDWEHTWWYANSADRIGNVPQSCCANFQMNLDEESALTNTIGRSVSTTKYCTATSPVPNNLDNYYQEGCYKKLEQIVRGRFYYIAGKIWLVCFLCVTWWPQIKPWIYKHIFSYPGCFDYDPVHWSCRDVYFVLLSQCQESTSASLYQHRNTRRCPLQLVKKRKSNDWNERAHFSMYLFIKDFTTRSITNILLISLLLLFSVNSIWLDSYDSAQKKESYSSLISESYVRLSSNFFLSIIVWMNCKQIVNCINFCIMMLKIEIIRIWKLKKLILLSLC